jgi:hypothetical protein
MKKTELKEVLKPLVKQIIKEMLFEEGFLSGIIKECINGVNGETLIEKKQVFKEEKKSNHLQETRKRMMDAIGKSAYSETLKETYEKTTPSIIKERDENYIANNPFAQAGISPNNPGVDLSIFGIK